MDEVTPIGSPGKVAAAPISELHPEPAGAL